MYINLYILHIFVYKFCTYQQGKNLDNAVVEGYEEASLVIFMHVHFSILPRISILQLFLQIFILQIKFQGKLAARGKNRYIDR